MIFRAMSVTVKVEVTGWLEMWALNSDLEESHAGLLHVCTVERFPGIYFIHCHPGNGRILKSSDL